MRCRFPAGWVKNRKWTETPEAGYATAVMVALLPSYLPGTQSGARIEFWNVAFHGLVDVCEFLEGRWFNSKYLASLGSFPKPVLGMPVWLSRRASNFWFWLTWLPQGHEIEPLVGLSAGCGACLGPSLLLCHLHGLPQPPGRSHGHSPSLSQKKKTYKCVLIEFIYEINRKHFCGMLVWF